MTTFEYIIGGGVLLLFFVIIISMLAFHYKLVADARVEEEREKFNRNAQKEAERRYKYMMKHTTYVFHRAPVVISNESDINWGQVHKIGF